jgi:hypothetical protein
MKNRAPTKARPENTVLDSVSRREPVTSVTPAELSRASWESLPGVPDRPSKPQQNPLNLEAQKRVRR